MSLPLWERVRIAWRDRDASSVDELQQALRSVEGQALPGPVQNAIEAQLAVIRGDVAGARKRLVGASKQRPLDPHEKLILGFILIDDGDTAKKLFSAVVQARIRDARVPEGLGQLAGRAGRLEEAVKHFEQAKKIDADNWNAHYALGLAQMDLANAGAARAAFEAATRLRPDFELAWLGYAQASIQVGAAAAASRVLGPVAQASGRDRIVLAYADCLVHAGDVPKALTVMTPIANVSQDVDLLLDYAELCLTGEFLDPAEKVLARVEQLAPERGRGWLLRGQLAELRDRKDVAAALAAYEKAVALDGGARAQNALALLLMRPTDLKSFERADQLLQAAADDPSPAGWAALSNLALLRRQQNRDAEAVSVARKVVQRAPKGSKARTQAERLIAELS